MSLEEYRDRLSVTRRLVLLPAILACILLAGGCSPGRSLESLSLLKAMAGGELAEQVHRSAVSFAGQTGTRQADLYRKPGVEPEAAIMILPGASPNGRDDPRVVALASQWAKSDFLVMVPEIENLRRLQVSAADADVMADSLRYLAHLAGPDRPVGAFGLSYAVGPLMVALLQPDLATRIDFLVALGGYYSSETVATFFTTGAYRKSAEERWRQGEPDAFGPWVFAHSNAGRLSDPGDEWRLRQIAQRRLDDETADIGEFTEGLGPEGLAVLAFLENDDPDAVPELSAALPEAIKAEMEALDLSRYDLSGPGPQLLLIHGKEDRVIPFTESLALARAVNGPDGDGRAEIFLLDAFEHTELGSTTVGDIIMMTSALYRVLEIRDRGPAARSDAAGE